MITKICELYGRQISAELLTAELLREPQLKRCPALKVLKRSVQCVRCGQTTPKSRALLPAAQFYCPQCINLGRISTLQPLCSLSEPNQFPINNNPLTWNGQLTSAQQDCAQNIINHFRHRQEHLLWAVTGAGKTEMLFPGIAWGIKQKYRIGIASPRVDVCMELFPRIKAAFANTSIVLLHGKQALPYQYAQITVCTTHQLLRFRAAFDILIIDEVDSFPYVQDPGLHYATHQAIKPRGRLLYLTATPSPELLKQVRRHQLALSYLPLRFHRHLLPTIKLHCKLNWLKQLHHGKLPAILIRLINSKLDQKRPFLLFVPKIKMLPVIDQLLKAVIKGKWTTVYSADPERLLKVQQMRERQLNFLITTTILERGVTFPGIDVIVLGADDRVFSTSALVQIAGRVGRKADRPDGEVDFIVRCNNRRLQQAQRQINHMNRLGARILNES